MFETLRFGKHKRAIFQLLNFPAGLFFLSQDVEGVTVFSPDAVCLCLLSKALLFPTTMNLFLTRALGPCPKVDQTVPVKVRTEAINDRPGGRSGFSGRVVH